MAINKEKVSCKYEGGMVCFYAGDCSFPSLTACLQQNLYLAQREISILKEKRNLRHSKVSIKWRNNSFYYKKKLKLLENWLISKKIPVPKIEELFPSPTVNSDSKDITQEERDVRVCDSNSTTVQPGASSPQPGSNGEPSNIKS